MSLDQKVVNDFLNNIDPKPEPKKTTTLQGVIVKNDSEMMLQLDGSNQLTPFVKAVDVKEGDRVIVELANHQATVVSNLTHPASAYTAVAYMQMTEDGLKIGSADSKCYTLQTPTGFNVMMSSGGKEYTLAIFSDDGVFIPPIDNNAPNIHLGNIANIITSTDLVTELLSAGALKLSSNHGSFGIVLDGDDKTVRLEGDSVQIKFPDTNNVYIQHVPGERLRLAFGGSGINILPDKIQARRDGNAYEILDANNVIMLGTASLPSTSFTRAAYATLTVDLTGIVPDGYRLMGARQISFGHNDIQLRQFTVTGTPSGGGTITALVYNGGSANRTTTATIKWWAIRNGAITTKDDAVIVKS